MTIRTILKRGSKGLLNLLLCLLLGAGLSLGSLGAQSAAEGEALIKDMERRINVETLDLSSTFTLVQKKEGETDKVIRIRISRRDVANRFTMIFQFPESEKGKGYFRNGDDLFLYLPSTREFVYRNRKDDVGSTDVRTDLFGRQDLLSQYKVASVGNEKVSKFDTWAVKLDAKALDVSFPVQKWYINKANNLPVKVENFSASGTLLRTVFYVDFKEVAPSKFIFTKLMSINNLEKNQRTLLQNDDISTSRIPDYVFSQAYLEEQSK